jgi:glycosyltransferase involved in cell wall biosynthesis
MKILWHSNAPWASTGYGNQTKLFVPRIQALGHEVTLSNFYGLAGGVLNLDDKTKCLPSGMNPWGNDILAAHAVHSKSDIVITLMDAWVLSPEVTSRVRWCPWLPIDHDPCPLPVKAALAPAWQPIAYSKFGEAKLKEAGFDPRYVPHGVDTKVYRPLEREACRKALKWSETAFIAIMVAANKGAPSRKAFPEVLWAWKQFVERHPDSLLYLHTWPTPEMQGVNIPELLQQLKVPDKSVMLADPYYTTIGYPDAFMVNVYNAANVLLNPSYGEGFGIPIVEAQACGTPVIVGDNTAMPELTFAGWKVKGQPFWTPQAAWQFVPNIPEIEQSLEAAWMQKDWPRNRERARDGALAYDADRVAQTYWKPVLEEIDANVHVGGELQMVDLKAATA